jgi:hypothetical protein
LWGIVGVCATANAQTKANLGLLSLMVGFILAQALWALNYWLAAPFLLGGALLLVIFMW